MPVVWFIRTCDMEFDHQQDRLRDRIADRALVVDCLRSGLGADTLDRIRPLAAGRVDWTHVDSLATRQGALPLVASRLQQAGVGPTGALAEAWRRSALETTAHNLACTAQLGRLLRLLSDHHIRTAAFKGPVLNFEIYGNVGARALRASRAAEEERADFLLRR
jgi:hypothetical protein